MSFHVTAGPHAVNNVVGKLFRTRDSFVLSRGATGRDVQQLGGNLAAEIVSYMRTNGLLK